MVSTDLLVDEHSALTVTIPTRYKPDFKILRSKAQNKMKKDQAKREEMNGKANQPDA